MKIDFKIILKKTLVVILTAFLFCSVNTSKLQAQNGPEVVVTLNEQFLNSFIDAMFSHLETPAFQLSKGQNLRTNARNLKVKNEIQNPKSKIQNSKCAESVTLLREIDNIKTGIRFADGKIISPIAFTGTYDVPLVGCTNFRGWAEADVTLEFDREKQTIFGRVKVTKVDLKGVPSLASNLVARLVQGTVNKRINPLEILRGEQISATVPVHYANGSLRLRVVNMQPEVVNRALNVRISYEFTKAN